MQQNQSTTPVQTEPPAKFKDQLPIENTVRVRNLIKKYEMGTSEVQALRGVNFEIQRGEYISIMGPSGSGKSTLFNMIGGLDKPTEGRVYIDEVDIAQLDAYELAWLRCRKIGYIFQSFNLIPVMTALENVSLPMIFAGMTADDSRDRAVEKLSLVELGDRVQHKPLELSGGQQQRVAVARAIVLEPEVLLLDEPLSNLDAKLRRHVREEIRQIQQEMGLTAVYVTHDQEEAMAVSDQIIVMRNAEIAQEGTPHDLYERPNSSFIADFIGDANLVDCEVIESGSNTSTVNVAGKTVSLETGFEKTGAAKLVLRPNHINLSKTKTADSFEASVTYAAYLGNQIQYSLTGELGDIFMIGETVSDPFVTGDNVQIHIDPKKAMLVQS